MIESIARRSALRRTCHRILLRMIAMDFKIIVYRPCGCVKVVMASLLSTMPTSEQVDLTDSKVILFNWKREGIWNPREDDDASCAWDKAVLIYQRLHRHIKDYLSYLECSYLHK